MGWYAAGGIENMLTIIFRVILSIAHTGYKVATVVKSRWAYVRRLSVKIWRQWQPRHDDSEIREESDILEKSLEEINKLPRHLCLLVGHEDQISFFDLVRILGWCIAVGIPYVSFYDHDGKASEPGEKFFVSIIKSCDLIVLFCGFIWLQDF